MTAPTSSDGNIDIAPTDIDLDAAPGGGQDGEDQAQDVSLTTDGDAQREDLPVQPGNS